MQTNNISSENIVKAETSRQNIIKANVLYTTATVRVRTYDLRFRSLYNIVHTRIYARLGVYVHICMYTQKTERNEISHSEKLYQASNQ